MEINRAVKQKHTYQLHVRWHIQPQGGNERFLTFLCIFSLIFFCIKRKHKTSGRAGDKAPTTSWQQRRGAAASPSWFFSCCLSLLLETLPHFLFHSATCQQVPEQQGWRSGRTMCPGPWASADSVSPSVPMQWQRPLPGPGRFRGDTRERAHRNAHT